MTMVTVFENVLHSRCNVVLFHVVNSYEYYCSLDRVISVFVVSVLNTLVRTIIYTIYGMRYEFTVYFTAFCIRTYNIIRNI